MPAVKEVLRTAAWILPASQLKNRVLRLLGHDVHPTAIARSCAVIRVDRVTMGPESRIWRWNLIKNMRLVSIGERGSIGRLNVISSHPVYKRLYPDGAELTLGSHAKITSRHQLDCSGSVLIGEYASMAGHQTRVLSHSVDVRRDVQVAHPVRIGARSFIGARCLLLGGAVLPERSVLGAGSVLTKSRIAGEPGLWAGVPATLRGPIDGKWFSRIATGTTRVYIPSTGETVEDAI